MTVENDIFAALKTLVSSRVYRDIAPATLNLETMQEGYITFQQVGGQAVNFLDTATIPSKKNGRFQINCWAGARDQVASLSRRAEDALRAYTALQTTVLGEPVATTAEDGGMTVLRGTIQDYSFWFTS